ncbi:MAG: hypothetical protein ACFFA0_03825 [Promethearchaeota archaeon]
MVNFLLLSEKIINYTKNQIDRGFTPQKVYELCSCIRETFCLSYSIRKNNNLYIYFQEENLLINFMGQELRYLGPDERSQALLLQKAINKGISIKSTAKIEKKESTPGIYVRKFSEDSSYFHYFNSIIKGNTYFIINQQFETEIENIEDTNFIVIPNYDTSTQETGLINRFRYMKNINFLSLSKIKPIENKILYINFLKDHQEVQ